MDSRLGVGEGGTLALALAVVALVVLAGPRAARADHPGDPVTVTTTLEQVGDRLVETSRHLDPLHALTPEGESVVAPATAESATARSLATTCSHPASGSDNTANAFSPAASRVLKVIYAYPTDVGNRFATYAPVIQSGIRLASELAAGETGNTRTLRFDLGTAAGAGCLDIQVVPLLLPTIAYTAVPSQTFTLLRTELLPQVVSQQGSRNFLVYADGITLPNVGGEGQVRTDDSVAGSLHNLGGLWAILYGRGGSDFFGSGNSYPAGMTSRSHVDLALHEISHTLGAVQRSAPHRSAAFHCLDEYDILCYDDDGAGGFSTFASCASPSAQMWDCNRDDYMNPSPAAGSYLATHWNIHRSAFMCPAGECAPGGVSGPPLFSAGEAKGKLPPDTKITRGPKKVRGRSARFSFAASDPGATFECSVDRGRFRTCTSPWTVRRLRPGRHTIQVRACGAGDNVDPSPASRKLTVARRR